MRNFIIVIQKQPQPKELVALLWNKGKLVREVTVNRFSQHIRIFDPAKGLNICEFASEAFGLKLSDLQSRFVLNKTAKYLTFKRNSGLSSVKENMFIITCDYELEK